MTHLNRVTHLQSPAIQVNGLGKLVNCIILNAKLGTACYKNYMHVLNAYNLPFKTVFNFKLGTVYCATIRINNCIMRYSAAY